MSKGIYLLTKHVPTVEKAPREKDLKKVKRMSATLREKCPYLEFF